VRHRDDQAIAKNVCRRRDVIQKPTEETTCRKTSFAMPFLEQTRIRGIGNRLNPTQYTHRSIAYEAFSKLAVSSIPKLRRSITSAFELNHQTSHPLSASVPIYLALSFNCLRIATPTSFPSSSQCKNSGLVIFLASRSDKLQCSNIFISNF
jgi:hypothetical protein